MKPSKMVVMPTSRVVYFDIDNTLILSASEYPHLAGDNRDFFIRDRVWIVHQPHLDLLFDFHARGHTIVLWSAGGAEWCRTVAEKLEIDRIVWGCLTKPDWFVDDLKGSEILPDNKRTYKESLTVEGNHAINQYK